MGGGGVGEGGGGDVVGVLAGWVVEQNSHFSLALETLGEGYGYLSCELSSFLISF